MEMIETCVDRAETATPATKPRARSLGWRAPAGKQRSRGVEQTVSQLLLDVYSDARLQPLKGFRAVVLGRLAQGLRAHTAWWESGSEFPVTASRGQGHGLPAAFDDPGREPLHADPLRRSCLEQPGEVIRVRAEGVASLPGAAWLIAVAWRAHAWDRPSWVVFGRGPSQPDFDETDARILRALMPHLVEAARHVLALHLRTVTGIDARAAWALLDDDGRIAMAAPAYLELLRAQWPSWRDGPAPSELTQRLMLGQCFLGSRCAFEPRSSAPLRLVEARWRSALDTLSAREREIGQLYAQGLTYAAIAARLSVAPSTVRNQIARVFEKLEVGNKAELVRRLHRLPPADAGRAQDD